MLDRCTEVIADGLAVLQAPRPTDPLDPLDPAWITGLLTGAARLALSGGQPARKPGPSTALGTTPKRWRTSSSGYGAQAK